MKKQFIITYMSKRYVNVSRTLESAKLAILFTQLNDMHYDTREAAEADILLDFENFPDRQYSIIEILTKI
ncbi:hypothetical protein MA9V1_020 [Chryseobacterium phage MA9V-1]|nr:hypothetical protein MA9V1_020 [Chryseobacterium phage MA9V-1]